MPFLLFQKRYFTGGAATSRGLVRKNNEDSYSCIEASGIFAVSDGMGGGDAGDLASAIVINAFRPAARHPMKDLSSIEILMHRANQEICEYAAKHYMHGMGATVVGILLNPFHPAEAILFFAGDSRCYRLRNHSLEQISKDHSIAASMGIPEDKIARELQSVITNAVGCGPRFFLETHKLELCSGDSFLLCSDGVSRQVPIKEIQEIMESDISASRKAKELVDAADRHGGRDNATAVVISFSELPEITPEIRQEEADCPDFPVCM